MKILEFLALHNYCEGLMVLTALIAFILTLRHPGRNVAIRIIPSYLGCLLIAMAIDFYSYSSPVGNRLAASLEWISTTVITLFEFCVFSLLILYYIESSRLRLAIKLIAVLFFAAEIVVFFWAFPNIPIFSICLLEAIALVPVWSIYFYEVFSATNSKSPKDQASLGLVIGIMSLGAYSLITFLSRKYLGRFADGAYAFGNLAYSVFFVLLVRACKRNVPESGKALGRVNA